MFDDFTWIVLKGDCGLSAEERLQMLVDYFQLIEDMDYIEHLFRHNKADSVQPMLDKVNDKLEVFLPKINANDYLKQVLPIVYNRLNLMEPK